MGGQGRVQGNYAKDAPPPLEGDPEDMAEVLRAYAPYALIVVIFSVAQIPAVKDWLAKTTQTYDWPFLDVVGADGEGEAPPLAAAPAGGPPPRDEFGEDFVKDVMPFVAKNYRVHDDAARRGVADQLQPGVSRSGVTITVVPIILFFIVVQRYFVRGLAGAVKG